MNFSRVWDLTKKSVYSWIDDYAPSMGAALAYYTLFSIAPLLIIVIAVAGFFFGQEAAQGEITAQLQGLMGKEGAVAVEGLLQSANQPTEGIVATLVSIVVLVIGATTVFGELQSDLDRIWRAPAAEQQSGIWALIRARLLSLGMVLAIGFLLLVSLVASAALAALGKWWGSLFGGWEALLHVVNFVVSFAVITGLFAMIYKILPRVDIAWHDVWIGAAVTALLFTIGKLLIGLYIGKTGVASGFGAAGSFVVLLVWVYYSTQIFLLGAEFTWVYAQEHGSRAGETARAASATQSSEVPPLMPGMPADVQTSTPAAMPVAIHHLNAVRHLDTAYSSTPRTPAATDLVGKTSAFFRDNPAKGLGIVASIGLLIGGLLREAAPPAKLLRLPRRRRAVAAAHPAPPRAIAPTKPAMPRVPAKPSVLQRLSRKWKIQAGRSLLRELMVAAVARLLATRVVRKRVATRKDTLIKRLALSLAENWVDRNRRLSKSF